MAVASLVMLTGVLLTVPLIPAFKEVRRKTDAEPLNVIQRHAGDIRHFAHSFAEVIQELKPVLERCHLYGRISAAQLIRVEQGCTFLRINAPRIELGTPLSAKESVGVSNNAVSGRHPGRLLYDGDFEIPAGEIIHNNIVTRGRLVIRAGARVGGSVKSNKDMLLEDGVTVEGSVISAERMLIGRNCVVHGPVIAERKMVIRTGTHCGDPQEATTVSSPEIEVEEGVLIFGTLWARQSGTVVGRQ